MDSQGGVTGKSWYSNFFEAKKKPTTTKMNDLAKITSYKIATQELDKIILTYTEFNNGDLFNQIKGKLQPIVSQPQSGMTEEEVDALLAEIDEWINDQGAIPEAAPEDALIGEIDDILEKIKYQGETPQVTKPQSSILKPKETQPESKLDLVLKEKIAKYTNKMEKKLNQIDTEYRNGHAKKAETLLNAYSRYLQKAYSNHRENKILTDIIQDIKNSISNPEELRDNLKELRRFSEAKIHRFYQSYPRTF